MTKEAMKLALEEMKIGNYNSAAERLETALAKPDFWEGYVPEPVKPYKGIADHINQATNGKMRIDPVTGDVGIGTQPTANICFFGTNANNSTEVLRLSKDGIWANPDIPVDEAAKLVLAAMEWNIKVLVDKAVADEREACAKVCYELPWKDMGHIPSNLAFAAAIRARGNT